LSEESASGRVRFQKKEENDLLTLKEVIASMADDFGRDFHMSANDARLLITKAIGDLYPEIKERFRYFHDKGIINIMPKLRARKTQISHLKTIRALEHALYEHKALQVEIQEEEHKDVALSFYHEEIINCIEKKIGALQVGQRE
jgi:hypothetical protein